MNRSGTRLRPLLVPLAAVVAVALLISGGLAWYLRSSDARCTGAIRLRMAVSQDTVGLFQRAADAYRGKGSVDGTCVEVVIDAKNSGTAMEDLSRGWREATDGPRPDIWSPASKVWVTLLRQRSQRSPVDATDPKPIMTTPLTIAMPKPMAQALGWPGRSIGWRDLAELAKDPRGWARYGHPEWGGFKLAKTNPHLSTSGLNATIGAYFAATGTITDLTTDDIADPRHQAFVRDLEHSIVHYGDITLTFLAALQRADDQNRALSHLSAVTVEEAGVWAYDQGNPSADPALLGAHPKPRTPLVAIYPSEGTIYSDHPFVRMSWLDPRQRRAADDFETWLHGDGQSIFERYGYRSWEGKAGPQIDQAGGLLPDGPKATLPLPAPDVLSKLLDTWDELRKPARVLLVMDRSGSMQATIPGTQQTKIGLARTAAVRSLAGFRPQDKVGLWQFSANLGHGKDWQQLQPIEPMDPRHRGALQRSISGLKVNGGTGLYNTAADAYQAIRSGSEPGSINAVVLLTDGRNEQTAGLDLETLLGRLGDHSGDPVRVFTIGYGADADQSVLQKIAQATDAAAYDSSDPNGIQEILTEVISNF